MENNPLLETWQIHNRINLYLLDTIDAASLATHSASKGRSVGEQFAHVHNVRLMWLKSAAPELLQGCTLNGGLLSSRSSHGNPATRNRNCWIRRPSEFRSGPAGAVG